MVKKTFQLLIWKGKKINKKRLTEKNETINLKLVINSLLIYKYSKQEAMRAAD